MKRLIATNETHIILRNGNIKVTSGFKKFEINSRDKI